MSAISWAGLEDFSAPASLSTASSGDDWFRSFMSSFALGLSTSFIWPGSGNGSLASAGASQFGNLRFARAGNSAVMGGQGDGFLLLNQNHLSLHHIGSSWTALLGHSRMIDHTPSSGRWLTQSAVFLPSLISGTHGSAGTLPVTFSTPYTSIPTFVQLSIDTTNGYAVNVSSVTTGGFIFMYVALRSATAITTMTWEAEGIA